MPIGRCLSTYGEWAQIEIDFLAQFLTPTSVVIDVGAHVGVHSVAFARLAKAGIVHSFEPQDILYGILLDNKSATGCGNIRPFNCAVGDKAGEGYYSSFPKTGLFNAGAVTVRETSGGTRGADERRTPIVALDSLDLPSLDLIKIDSEGSGRSVLEGARDILTRFRPVVFQEANSVSEAWEAAEFGRPLGYRAFLVGIPAFNPENFAGSAENFLGLAHESGVVLVPPSQEDVFPPARGHFSEVSTLDALIAAFGNIPRFGDETEHDHNPVKLVAERKALKGLVEDQRRRLETAQQALDAAQTSIGRLDGLLEERNALLRDLQGEVRDQRRRARRGEMNLALALTYRRFLRRVGIVGMLDRIPSLSMFNTFVRATRKSGLFDRQWYLENYEKLEWPDDPLIHYLLIGGFEGRDPNPVFSSDWYLRNYGDVADSGHNPLVHYILYGAKEGRAAGPNFDTAAYLRGNPDVAASGVNPLSHYLKIGRGEGRKSFPVAEQWPVPAQRPAAPPWAAFEALVKQDKKPERPGVVGGSVPTIDVVVPVYRGLDDTLACLFAVLTAPNKASLELIVINDASPESELAAALERLAKWGLVSLISNTNNLGFVKSANLGLALHDDRDVVLLNSDAIVYNNWLDRLRAQASRKGVGTVTPLSNNATICSYPVANRPNGEPQDCDYHILDRLCSEVNAGRAENIPTAIGFCMYIRRETLDEIGHFDAETFGRGYGEENDFCMRASAAGWRNVAALDTFVRHSGETSFGLSAKERQREGLQRVLSKHPQYLDLVHEHAAKDPLAPARRRIDAARLAAHLGTSTSVLCIAHVWGGGVHRHLIDKGRQLKGRGIGLVTLLPASPMSMTGKLGEIDGKLDLPNLNGISLEGSLAEFAELLGILKVKHIEVHSLVGWSFETVRRMPEIASRLGVTYDVMLHDYAPVCPQINLIDATGLYCGERGIEQCRLCLLNKKSRAETVHGSKTFPDRTIDIETWRAAYGGMLKGASAVYAPSNDTAARMSTYFPDVHIQLVPHAEDVPTGPTAIKVNPGAKRLRVATIGAIGPHKGSRILLGCARDARRRGLPIDFSIVGYTSLDGALRSCGNVSISGPYHEEQVYSLLAQAEPHVVFLPAVWPETFSYTLSVAIASELPIVVFDLGAPAERLRQLGIGNLLPLAMARNPSAINDWLLNTFERQSKPTACDTEIRAPA